MYKRQDIGLAIKQAMRLLESVSKKNKHIYILTDRDTNGWDKNYFSAIETKIQHPIHIIDFSEMRSGVNQAAVTHSEAQQTYLNNSRIVKVKIKAANLLESKPIKKLNVSLCVDCKKKIEGKRRFYKKYVKQLNFDLLVSKKKNKMETNLCPNIFECC